jgi:hypothetical protein
MSSLRTFLSFQERSDAAIERYKLASPEWRERVAPCQQLKILHFNINNNIKLVRPKFMWVWLQCQIQELWAPLKRLTQKLWVLLKLQT